MDVKVEIRRVEKREGVSSKTGKPYSMAEAHCLVTNIVDGEPQETAGTMLLPRGQEGLGRGIYYATMGMRVGQKGHIEAYVSSLVEVSAAKVARAA